MCIALYIVSRMTVPTWRSEDHLQKELVLSFYDVGPGSSDLATSAFVC